MFSFLFLSIFSKFSTLSMYLCVCVCDLKKIFKIRDLCVGNLVLMKKIANAKILL